MLRSNSLCLLMALLVFLSLSCEWNRYPQTLDINEMKLIVWDMLKADELFTVQQAKDSTLRINKKNLDYYEKVFSVHKITRAEFYQAYAFYEANPLKMKELIDSLDQFAARERNRSFQRYGQGTGSSAPPVSQPADSSRKP